MFIYHFILSLKQNHKYHLEKEANLSVPTNPPHYDTEVRPIKHGFFRRVTELESGANQKGESELIIYF